MNRHLFIYFAGVVELLFDFFFFVNEQEKLC